MLKFLKSILPHETKQMLKRSLLSSHDMQSRLGNLKRSGFVATGAIDGGAYQGEWTEQFWRIWPTVPCMLIEPLPKQQQILGRIANKVQGSRVFECAIADCERIARFNLGETNSRIDDDCDSENSVQVQVHTLDNLLSRNPNFNPNLLKLDLQGFELCALDGCKLHLRNFEVIIIEVSTLRIGEVPIFREVDKYFEQLGYSIYDLIPGFYRPRDGALWQLDVFYVRDNSALVQSRSWL